MKEFDRVLLAVVLLAPIVLATLVSPNFVRLIVAPLTTPREAAAEPPTPATAVIATNVTPAVGIGVVADSQETVSSDTRRHTSPPIAAPSATPAAAPRFGLTLAEPRVPASRAAHVPTPASASEPAPTAVPALAMVEADAPTGAISLFYALVSGREFDAAEALWSAHMRSRFPPHENIVSRFRETQAIGLQRAEVVAESKARATVAVDVVETDTRDVTRRFVGRWHLVRGQAGWLLDAPELQPAR